MPITSFKDMYVTELQELMSLEGQLGQALLRMAEAASHPSLKDVLMRHREKRSFKGDASNPCCESTAPTREPTRIRPCRLW